MITQPVAFLSYAHLDDMGASREVTLFHDRLQSELSIHTGRIVHIFFDKKFIGWGKRWAEFVDNSLDKAAFLEPILTPSFFQSHACREEYLKFANSEETIGRRDLILPIYYVKCLEMSYPTGKDQIVDDILSRPYRDWRGLRHKPVDSHDLLKEFADLASIMADAFFEIQDLLSKDKGDIPNIIEGGRSSSGYFDQLLDQTISYESLVAYAVEIHPDLPVSRAWTRQLLFDIDINRYETIRDIDRKVRFAKSKVDDYARENPRVFGSSTDFITKSLIFVDSGFRQAHSVGPDTMAVASKANITRY